MAESAFKDGWRKEPQPKLSKQVKSYQKVKDGEITLQDWFKELKTYRTNFAEKRSLKGVEKTIKQRTDNDIDAFERFYERYFPIAVKIIYGKLSVYELTIGDREACSITFDIAQDIFKRVFELNRRSFKFVVDSINLELGQAKNLLKKGRTAFEKYQKSHEEYCKKVRSGVKCEEPKKQPGKENETLKRQNTVCISQLIDFNNESESIESLELDCVDSDYYQGINPFKRGWEKAIVNKISCEQEAKFTEKQKKFLNKVRDGSFLENGKVLTKKAIADIMGMKVKNLVSMSQEVAKNVPEIENLWIAEVYDETMSSKVAHKNRLS